MKEAPDQSSRFAGCLLGLAAGNAVGTTVDFKPRGSFDAVTDLRGDSEMKAHAAIYQAIMARSAMRPN